MVALIQNPFLIPALPLAAFVLILLGGKKLSSKAAWISILASFACFIFSIPLLLSVLSEGTSQESFLWLDAGSVRLSAGFLLDPLSASMLAVVSLVGTLIQIYSAGYMKGDSDYPRFFGTLSLFMAAMLLLVIADNFLLFFMAWEIMGLCSYLLIGFWFQKEAASKAAKKAFLTTRLGDMGLLLGILTLLAAAGTLQFSELSSRLDTLTPSLWLSAAGLLIFSGTIGKSAQFPLHIWLPDAMEGPTPVSALIHAATMVAAGVYLIVRAFPLLEKSPDVLFIIACTGTLTAFLAACLALSAVDIKKILAFSTISQLGFMTAAVGFGNPAAAMFHLITHAFFKALLFMGAGSVIHGCKTQDIRELGGLGSVMKSTSVTFLMGSLALAGVPPLSGFWSKEGILASAAGHGGYFYSALLLTALLTALYIFRLYFSVFSGAPRAAALHAHESPRSMTLPLWILAAFALLAGLPGSSWNHHALQEFLSGHESTAHTVPLSVILFSAGTSLCGILLAFILYLKPDLRRHVSTAFGPVRNLMEFLGWKLPNLTAENMGAGCAAAAQSAAVSDRVIIDSFVLLPGTLFQLAASVGRRIQTGFIQNYLLIAFTGVIAILVLCLN